MEAQKLTCTRHEENKLTYGTQHKTISPRNSEPSNISQIINISPALHTKRDLTLLLSLNPPKPARLRA